METPILVDIFGSENGVYRSSNDDELMDLGEAYSQTGLHGFTNLKTNVFLCPK